MYNVVFKAWQYYVLYTIVKLQVVCIFACTSMCDCKYILCMKYWKNMRKKW
jgi:hypothetical protein